MGDNQPLVSVIMPCFNAMPYLPMALDSILNQTYKNLEIILLNDGSTDGSAQYLNEIAERDHRIILVTNEENIGLIRTLNKGIDIATGDFIARMDADDYSTPDRLEKQFNFLIGNGYDLISCAGVAFKNNFNIIEKRGPKATLKKAIEFVSLLSPPIMHGGVFCLSSVLRNNKFSTERNAEHTEDYELFARLIRLGYKLGCINEFLYFVRKDNPNSVSHVFKEVQNFNFLYTNKIHVSLMLGLNVPELLRQVFLNRLPNRLKFKDSIASAKELKSLKKNFLEKNKKEISTMEIKEINTYLGYHVLDIVIQLAKKKSLILITSSLFWMFYFGESLLNLKVVRYFFIKFRKW